ncbi:MAG: TetR/AcrR family transcriptional regulator [Acidobacteria bacterium]|nr:TetR/AcrR family transcriptional regulator [Acidobacteriota bacterium]
MAEPQTSRSVELSSQERLLAAAKRLFSGRGYENTSTAMIAREALTSESQLVKHFGGKEGLLEAIFDDGWDRLSAQFPAIDAIPNNRQKLGMILELFLRAFEQDPLLKELMLLESRRMRKASPDVMLTRGYQGFLARIDAILQDMSKQGELKPGLTPVAVRSAVIGMMEGMLREQLLFQRHQGSEPLDREMIRKVFTLIFGALLT